MVTLRASLSVQFNYHIRYHRLTITTHLNRSRILNQPRFLYSYEYRTPKLCPPIDISLGIPLDIRSYALGILYDFPPSYNVHATG